MPKSNIRFVSMLSGIEAASVAFGPLGWEAAWFAEIEPFPCAVLAHHYPGVPNLGDVTLLPQKILNGEVEAPEVICGGSPCQGFSVAGKRLSLDDLRSNLALAYLEVCNAVDIRRRELGLQPAIILWEQVPGVLHTHDNAFGCFLGGLAGEDVALQPPGGRWTDAGYVRGPKRAAAWRILSAEHFRLAQRRRRVFVVASARPGFHPEQVLFEFQGVRRDSPPSRQEGEGPSPDVEAGPGAGVGGSVGEPETYENHAQDSRVKPVVISPQLNAKAGTGGGNLPLVRQHVFGGNRTSGERNVAASLLAQPGSGYKGDFESENFVVEPKMTDPQSGHKIVDVAPAMQASFDGGFTPTVLQPKSRA